MRVLTLILITTYCVSGQCQSDKSSSDNFNDVVGEYVVFWSLTKGSTIGENIELKKNGKFAYSVFAISDGVGYTEKLLASGRYKITGDTVNLNATRKLKPAAKSDVFNLRGYYLLKIINRQENELKGKGDLICLVPGDKVDTWHRMVDEYLGILNDVQPQIRLWNGNIFTGTK